MPKNDQYSCPVCGIDGLLDPAYDSAGCASFEICPSCGTEFGYDDARKSHQELRKLWVASGALWHSRNTAPPPNWNGKDQLRAAVLQESN
jgi:predicted RNA-binding Zn-ribbon protein involved in translation (DUF1610 family)